MPSLNGADGCAEVTRLRFLGCDAIPLTFPIRWCPFDLGHPPWSSLRLPRYVAVGKIGAATKIVVCFAGGNQNAREIRSPARWWP